MSDSLLRLRLDADAAYRPRVDLLWSLSLDEPRRHALAWALDRDMADITHLPVVGIEIEGTAPTTKTMESDVANLAALGAPLNLLVVSEEGERNIYRRAARVIRTVRRAFGDLAILPFEAAWLDQLTAESWPEGACPVPAPPLTAPRGGETRDWSRSARATLRWRGQEAGFVVAEPYRPGLLRSEFERVRGRWRDAPTHTVDPLRGRREPMGHHADYLTASEIDLAWLLPLPAALGAFLARLEALDPALPEHGLLDHTRWSRCAVAAFELESGGGKRAGGALLNLAAYGVLGLAVVPDPRAANELGRTLRTYQPTLGLRNVFVKALP